MRRPTGIAGGFAVVGLLAGGVLLPAPAQAAQDPVNGVIAFVSDRDGGGVFDDIYITSDAGDSAARVVADEGQDSSPAVSPDGKYLAYVSDVTGNPEAYVCRLHPNVPRPFCDETVRLTTTPGAEASLKWFPDSRTLVYAYSTPAGPGASTNIFRVAADGSAVPVQITNDAQDLQPAVSPDGATILFSSARAGTLDIYRMNADGTDEQRWIASPAVDSGADWSPDGSQIAFASNRSGNLDVYRIDAAAPESATNIPVDVTSTTTMERFPSWSPDGSRIAFWSYPSGAGFTNGDISTIAADGTDRRDVTADYAGGDITPSWGRSFNWRPVG